MDAVNDNELQFPATCHEDTVTLYRYWREKCGRRRMPARADLDPLEMPPRLLPFITIVDVVPDARRFVYRLVGTGEVEARGNDPTGKSVAEGFFGYDMDEALSWYERTVQTGRPHMDAEPFIATNGRYVSAEAIFLPLSTDGTKVDKVLVFSHSRRTCPAVEFAAFIRRSA